MPNVTIQISEDDYRDMVSHLARGGAGRPLVAVNKVLDENSKASIQSEQEFLKEEKEAKHDHHKS